MQKRIYLVTGVKPETAKDISHVRAGDEIFKLRVNWKEGEGSNDISTRNRAILEPIEDGFCKAGLPEIKGQLLSIKNMWLSEELSRGEQLRKKWREGGGRFVVPEGEQELNGWQLTLGGTGDTTERIIITIGGKDLLRLTGTVNDKEIKLYLIGKLDEKKGIMSVHLPNYDISQVELMRLPTKSANEILNTRKKVIDKNGPDILLDDDATIDSFKRNHPILKLGINEAKKINATGRKITLNIPGTLSNDVVGMTFDATDKGIITEELLKSLENK